MNRNILFYIFVVIILINIDMETLLEGIVTLILTAVLVVVIKQHNRSL